MVRLLFACAAVLLCFALAACDTAEPTPADPVPVPLSGTFSGAVDGDAMEIVLALDENAGAVTGTATISSGEDLSGAVTGSYSNPRLSVTFLTWRVSGTLQPEGDRIVGEAISGGGAIYPVQLQRQ